MSITVGQLLYWNCTHNTSICFTDNSFGAIKKEQFFIITDILNKEFFVLFSQVDQKYCKWHHRAFYSCLQHNQFVLV